MILQLQFIWDYFYKMTVIRPYVPLDPGFRSKKVSILDTRRIIEYFKI